MLDKKYELEDDFDESIEFKSPFKHEGVNHNDLNPVKVEEELNTNKVKTNVKYKFNKDDGIVTLKKNQSQEEKNIEDYFKSKEEKKLDETIAIEKIEPISAPIINNNLDETKVVENLNKQIVSAAEINDIKTEDTKEINVNDTIVTTKPIFEDKINEKPINETVAIDKDDIKSINKGVNQTKGSDNNKGKKKKNIIIPILIAILLFVAIGLGLYTFLKPNDTPLIDFVGMSEEEVNQWIEDNELDPSLFIFVYENSEDIDENIVIEQDMEVDTVLDEEPVKITVSSGPDYTIEVELIDFTDLKEEDIIKFFTENKFNNVKYEYEQSNEFEEGKFIKINIDTPTATRDALIVVTISAGEKEVAMPDFSNSSVSNVDAWAEENAINVKYTQRNSNTIAKNYVISFSPSKDTIIKAGDTIEVVISLGKSITMIDLNGKTKTEVDTYINDNNLKVNYTSEYSSSTLNTVISTNPTKGTTLAEGQTINVVLSVGLVPINNYVGQSYSALESYIASVNQNYNKSANITLNKVEQESSTVEAGKVISMSFDSVKYDDASDAKANAKPDNAITVVVAKAPKVNVTAQTSTEAEFIAYLTGLNLKAGTRTESYSDTVPNGNIITNQTGSYEQETSINYTVSIGAYNPAATDFNNQTPNTINSTLSAANEKGAGNWSFTNLGEKYSSAPTGQTLDCTIANKVVSCYISKGVEPVPTTVGSYVGQHESTIKAILATGSLNAGRSEAYSDTIPGGSIISNDTGDFYSGDTVNYVVSIGPEPTANITNALDAQVVKNDPNATKSNIESHLKGLGFTQVTVEIISDPINSGEIINPSSHYGEKKLTTPIHIQVSSGPA